MRAKILEQTLQLCLENGSLDGVEQTPEEQRETKALVLSHTTITNVEEEGEDVERDMSRDEIKLYSKERYVMHVTMQSAMRTRRFVY